MIGAEETMDYLKKLNEEQREAAMCTEGASDTCGAGSGKTSTMTHRIAYMIEEKGISPYNILAVTFTNKAAKEMRDRVEALIGVRDKHVDNDVPFRMSQDTEKQR